MLKDGEPPSFHLNISFMKKVLLIVDPQNDFITGSLAVEGAEEKMMKLAEYIKNSGHMYDAIYVTMDTHPEDHCSFKENGGIWPTHCVYDTNGWNLPEYLDKPLSCVDFISYYYKGTKVDKEEYSIFDNAEDGLKLRNQIEDMFKEHESV